MIMYQIIIIIYIVIYCYNMHYLYVLLNNMLYITYIIADVEIFKNNADNIYIFIFIYLL